MSEHQNTKTMSNKSIQLSGLEIKRDNGSGYSLAQAFPNRRFRDGTIYTVRWNGVQLDRSTVTSITRVQNPVRTHVITSKRLLQLQSRIAAAVSTMARIESLRVGVIEGAPDINPAKSAVADARAEFLAALREAGPRLRAKFGATDWEYNFNPDGTVRH